ncbi:hypothetical protein Avbf_05681 [Armadillidium vulgare]|nr:hypothetical protein Avbf_05681 [Armadillidium vulgare]
MQIEGNKKSVFFVFIFNIIFTISGNEDCLLIRILEIHSGEIYKGRFAPSRKSPDIVKVCTVPYSNGITIA